MKLILTLSFFCISFLACAQAPPCTGLGRTPETAIPLCGQLSVSQPAVPSCAGNPLPTTGCTTTPYTSSNSIWYRFHCYFGGNFGFIINPTVATDDFDWILIDITGHSLADIFTTNLYVAYNLSGIRGQTGATTTGTGLNICASGQPFCQRPALTPGHDYMLMVNNFSNSGNGYNLQFVNNSAGLFDDNPPNLASAATNGCNPSQIKVKFDKPIRCNSITSSASEFSIQGAVITGLQSDCTLGYEYVDEVVLNLQSPLVPGTYSVVVNTGSDGNTLTDVCGNDMLPLATVDFQISPVQPLQIANVIYTPCMHRTISIVFSKKILCGSISNNANEFQISGLPGNIIFLSNTCTNPMAAYDTIKLLMAAPLTPGNYLLTVVNGSDGNTVVDSCNNNIIAGTTFSFNVVNPPAPIFDSVVVTQCSPNTVTAWFSSALNCGSVYNIGDQFQIMGPSPVSIINITSPVSCYGTRFLTFRLSQSISVGGTYTLKAKKGAIGTTVADTCGAYMVEGESINFDVQVKPSPNFNISIKRGCDADTVVASHPGGIGVSSYRWTFGDGTQMSGQTISRIFPNGAASTTLKLVVANTFCRDSVTVPITLDNAFTNAFTVNTDSTCMNTDAVFTNNSQGNSIQYQWNFGDNTTFNGFQPPPHQYAFSGSYTITLTATDIIGCKKVTSKTIFVASAPVITVQGIADEYCTGKQITVTANIQGPATAYRWETGNGAIYSNTKTLSYIYRSPGTYTLKFIASNRFCGETVFSKDVVIKQSPYVNLGYDITLCPDSVAKIGILPQPGYTYLWNTGQTTPSIITVPSSATYTLTVGLDNCTESDEIFVRVMTNCLIKVPGAFTPNGDGLNDYLKAINADLAKEFNFKIYNRYGTLIFETTDPLKGWDGRYQNQPADAGTYIWQISFIDPLSNKRVFDKGSSILIR